MDKVKSLSEEAYDYILSRIISFDFPPNKPIVETDICTELGISRTPLREALRKLEAAGFVIKIKNCGTFVRPFTQEDLLDCCELRSMFELRALRDMIYMVDPEELHELKETLIALPDPLSAKEFHPWDRKFHQTITKYCTNRKIVQYLDDISLQIAFIRTYSAQTPDRITESRKEHLAIIEAIEDVDLETAFSMLKQHLDHTRDSCLRSYRNLRSKKVLSR